MTVVEISPGTGWYTEILAPFLKDHGKLYEAVGGGAGAKTFEDKLKADPASYGQVVVTTLQPPAETEIAPAGTADLVLRFATCTTAPARHDARLLQGLLPRSEARRYPGTHRPSRRSIAAAGSQGRERIRASGLCDPESRSRPASSWRARRKSTRIPRTRAFNQCGICRPRCGRETRIATSTWQSVKATA